MTCTRIISIIAIAMIMAPPVFANRITCSGSNGERQLARIVGVTEYASPVFADFLKSFADETGSNFYKTKSVYPDGQRSSKFHITDSLEKFEITVIRYKGTDRIEAEATRTCLSDNAEDWESVWAKLIQKLNQKGLLLNLAHP